MSAVAGRNRTWRGAWRVSQTGKVLLVETRDAKPAVDVGWMKQKVQGMLPCRWVRKISKSSNRSNERCEWLPMWHTWNPTESARLPPIRLRRGWGLMGLGNRWQGWRLAYLCPLPFLELIELQTHWKMATQCEVFLHTVHCILCTGVLIICSSWFIKDHHKSGHKHNLLQISGCCYKLLDDVFRSQPKFSGPQNIWNMSRRQSVGMADMEDVGWVPPSRTKT